MERISSRQNAVVKRFRELARAPRAAPGSARSAHAPPHAGGTAEVLLDGEHLVHEALACDLPIELAAFSDAQLRRPRSPLERMARDVTTRGGRVLAVSEDVLAAISPVQHPSGVVAIGHARAADVRAVMSTASALPLLVVVLAGVQDPGNVGAIIRAAAAFGASGVVAIEGSANPFGWKALRGGMGATLRIPVASRGTLPDVIEAAHDGGVRLVAAVPRNGTPLTAIDLRSPTAIVLGGEGAGISSDIVSAVEQTVTIPMGAPVESLNVAVAAGVILYEALRQRRA